MYILKKKQIKDATVVGTVKFSDIQKSRCLSEKELSELEDDSKVLSIFGEHYKVQEDNKKIQGYIQVEGENQVIGVQDDCHIPLFLWAILGNIIAAILLICSIVVVVVLAKAIIDKNDKDNSIKIQDTVPYDDSPVDITSSEASEVIGEDGEIDANLYYYHTVGQGESLDLTNLSSNDVYLVYIITDGNGNKVYETGKIEPGTADPWIPSKYLPVGENHVVFTVTPYTMDNQQCVGYDSNVTIVVK